MAPKAMDARKRVDRNRRFRVRLRERDRKWILKPKRVPFQERKRSDVSELRGSDPTTFAFAATGRSYSSWRIHHTRSERRCCRRRPWTTSVSPPVGRHRGAASVGGAHGPESGRCKESLRPEPSLSRPWAAPTVRGAFTIRDRSDGVVGGAHGPESGRCRDALRPEPSLSHTAARTRSKMALQAEKSAIQREKRERCPRVAWVVAWVRPHYTSRK